MVTEVGWAEFLGLVVLPLAVGLSLSKGIAQPLRARGASPLAVRLARILVTVVWVSVAVLGLELVFGPFNFLSTLTVSAVAGLAVTLALQTTLQNILASFLLMRNGFLRYGDSVQFSGVKGTVASIGLVTTVLRSEAGPLVFVSNANLLSGPLTNFSASDRLGPEY